MARIDELFFNTDEHTSADDPRLLELDMLTALVEEFEQARTISARLKIDPAIVLS